MHSPWTPLGLVNKPNKKMILPWMDKNGSGWYRCGLCVLSRCAEGINVISEISVSEIAAIIAVFPCRVWTRDFRTLQSKAKSMSHYHEIHWKRDFLRWQRTVKTRIRYHSWRSRLHARRLRNLKKIEDIKEAERAKDRSKRGLKGKENMRGKNTGVNPFRGVRRGGGDDRNLPNF